MNEMNMPLVSVIMPTYNADRFLSQAIDSVLHQTYRNLELIVVDDCSADNSVQIVQKYTREDARVRLITKENNQGVARARNAGIEAAKGQYIALLDSDDVWEKAKLEKQMKLLKEASAQIAYCSMLLIDEEGRKIRSFMVPKTTEYSEMLHTCYLSCSTVVIEAELLKSHPFRTDFYHEDYVLWLELLALNVKAVGETEVLAYYRQSAGSRSHGKIKSAINRWRIYREALGMGIVKSCLTFVRYAVGGIRKYYL